MNDFKEWLQDRASNIDFITLLIAVVIVVSLLEWQMNPPHCVIAVVCSLAHIFAVSLMRFWPIESGEIVVFIYCCFSLLPLNEGVSQYWGVWVALGFLGYHRFWKNGLVMMMVAVSARMLQYYVFQAADDSSSIAMMMSCSFIFAWCIGGMFRREVAINCELQALHQERLQYQREKRVAAEIHDAVSGQLSYAILLSQRMDKTPQTIISGMKDASVKAMNSLYQIIDYLNDESERDLSESDSLKESHQRPSDRLGTMLREEEHRLASIGFAGRIAVQGDPARISTEGEECLSGLLRELFANIMRHGEPSEPYYLSIVFSLHEITVVQSNTIRKEQSAIPASRGHGLVSLKQRIANRGGVVRQVLEDGSWTLYASIPL
ncbi:hypothetical protein GFD17_07895 [Bifidobacterium sp. SMB2]|uniref:Histidine kinase n=1 Tax=Bifidobacterium saimiriisciurei TaxID=2661627 RepID=A0ABX0C9L4_9BIFI|nr:MULTISPECIES: hypothetical protein [Bifidobacterium]NEG96672.1 hypothetical protein [Bifidobacterium sp. SMB2]NEH11828.1 hypothetical protein [Bifidobacterium saimiriisciurei]